MAGRGKDQHSRIRRKTQGTFVGWWRASRRSAWRQLLVAGSEREAELSLLVQVQGTGGDSMVLEAGVHPNDTAAAGPAACGSLRQP